MWFTRERRLENEEFTSLRIYINLLSRFNWCVNGNRNGNRRYIKHIYFILLIHIHLFSRLQAPGNVSQQKVYIFDLVRNFSFVMQLKLFDAFIQL